MWPAEENSSCCAPSGCQASRFCYVNGASKWWVREPRVNEFTVFNTDRLLFALERCRDRAVWAHRALCVLP